MTDQPNFGKTHGGQPSWFARVPTAAVRDQSLTPAEFRVLAAICAYANNQGFAWPNQSTIIEDIGTSQNTIDRAMRKLKKKKYLTVVSRHRSHPAWKRVMGNVYRIMFDDGLETDKLIDAMKHEENMAEEPLGGPENTESPVEGSQTPETTEKATSDDPGEEGNHVVKVDTEQLVAAEDVARWYSAKAEQSHGARPPVDRHQVELTRKLLADGWSVAELKLEAIKKLQSLRAAGQPAPHNLAHAMRGVR